MDDHELSAVAVGALLLSRRNESPTRRSTTRSRLVPCGRLGLDRSHPLPRGERYAALRGSGAVVIGNEEHPLDAGHLVAVDAGTERFLASGPNGLRVLCIGGVPGGV